MSESLIPQICDVNNEDRDLLVDELNDEFEAGLYSTAESFSIINKLLELLKSEQDASVQESILNLLSGIYPSGIAAREIERYVLNSIQDFQPGPLVHALSILSESELGERKEIFISFLKSENKTIQRIAESYLLDM